MAKTILKWPPVRVVALTGFSALWLGVPGAAGPLPARALPSSAAVAETAEAGDHLVRHCEDRAKEEYCTWVKAGSQRVSKH